MVSSRVSWIAVASVLTLTFGTANAAVPPPSAMDLTVGDWQLNVAKSSFGCGKAPVMVRAHIFEAGWNLTVVEWNGTQADGKPLAGRRAWRYDGERYPDSILKPGAQEAIIFKMTDPRHVELKQVDLKDTLLSTGSREVSADGQTMTETRKQVGKACEDIEVFERY